MEIFTSVDEQEPFCEHCGPLAPFDPVIIVNNVPWCLDCGTNALECEGFLMLSELEKSLKANSDLNKIKWHKAEITRLEAKFTGSKHKSK